MIATAVLFGSLGLDTFAVALGIGVSGLPRSTWIRLGLIFAAFEGGMPVIGLLVGRRLGPEFGPLAVYLAAALLLLVGVLAIREALGKESEIGDAFSDSSASFRSLMLTGVSIGLDELAVGFSLGVLGVSLGLALGCIAIQAFALTLLGLFLGERVGARLGERAELASGIVLSLLAIAVFFNESTGAGFL